MISKTTQLRGFDLYAGDGLLYGWVLWFYVEFRYRASSEFPNIK